jgi:uncharacterized glyoxalase superfamily protein PhnB
LPQLPETPIKPEFSENMSAPILSPAIPQLPSGNLQRTHEFFRDILGFDKFAMYAEEGHLIICRGQTELHFWDAKSESAAKKIGSVSSCYIRVKHIDALFAEFKAKGASFGYELTRQPWGMNEMQVNDPYGNAIRFGEEI